MLGYRKSSFYRAHSLLTNLRANLDDLSTLRELQFLLLREVIRAEIRIRELKADLKQSIAGSDNINKSATYLEKRIDGFRQCAFVWRCFGDSIAFLYMDKFALKQTFLNTHNVNPKQDAGFIAGKDGLEREISLLEAALAHSVPALLVDLTNTIRHGDVCLMGASDPYLIEVKSSLKLNQRGKKQQRSIEKLHGFFSTDRSLGLRGIPDLRREAYRSPERSYTDQLNHCIVEAISCGHAVRQPEPGLFYIVMARSAINEVMNSLGLKRPWLFLLNERKTLRDWAPYYPFVLSIENKDHLWAFIKGDIYILVIMEIDALLAIFAARGAIATFNTEDPNYPVRVDVSGDGGLAGISDSLLARIGMEFVSPEWLIDISFETFELGAKSVQADSGVAGESIPTAPE
ncbi:hypothetical protein [Mesorhizobium sp. ISC15]|uniref:hypothetical protein n=1 Tax=Mesorhizobium sp. ISC15 TaxID=3076429 RepID=UPI00301DD09A